MGEASTTSCRRRRSPGTSARPAGSPAARSVRRLGTARRSLILADPGHNAGMGTILDAIAGLPPWLVLGLVFLLPALEASTFIGIVVPGEIAVLVGGVIAHTGSLPLWA